MGVSVHYRGVNHVDKQFPLLAAMVSQCLLGKWVQTTLQVLGVSGVKDIAKTIECRQEEGVARVGGASC